MEYTQEQLDALISTETEKATKGLYNEDDLKLAVNKETDRRVESGITKGLETYKAKWQTELEAKAKLTSDELVKAEFTELQKTLDDKESALNLRSNLLEAKGKLSEAKIPETYYGKLIGNLVTSDVDNTISNIDNLISVYVETRKSIENEIKAGLTNIPNPKGDKGNGTVDKKSFNKMSYMEKLELKTSNPELYKSLMK